MLYKTAEDVLREKIGELELVAKELAEKHWVFHLEENMDRPPKEKARLNLWVRRRGDILELYWSKMRFAKASGQDKSKVHYHYIPKGRANAYKYATLARHAQEWEIDTVWGFEEQVAEIRREYAEIRKALWYIKRAKKKTLTNESQALESEDQPEGAMA